MKKRTIKAKALSLLLTITLVMQGYVGTFTAKAEDKLGARPTNTIEDTANGNVYYPVNSGNFNTGSSTAFLKDMISFENGGTGKSINRQWADLGYYLNKQRGWEYGSSSDKEDWDSVLSEMNTRLNAQNKDTYNAEGAKSEGIRGTGEENKYYVYHTGLLNASSLSDANSKITDFFYNNYRANEGSRDDKDDVVSDCAQIANSSEKQDVFVDSVGAFREYDWWKGKSGHYAGYAVLHYGFKVQPILDSDTINKTKVVGDEETETESDTKYINGVENISGSDMDASQNITKTSSTSVGSSISGSKSYGYEESINIGMNAGLPGIFEINADLGFSASQVVEQGWSNDESKTDEMSQDSSVSVTLPPYTKTILAQSTKNTAKTVQYYCPVSITYNTMVIQYQLSTSDNDAKPQAKVIANFTDNATDQLKLRAITNQSGSISDPENIKWGDKACLGSNEAMDSITWLTNNRPVSYEGGTMTLNTQEMSTQLDKIVPVKPLGKTAANGDIKHLEMSQNDVFYVNNLSVNGYNADGLPYYGFDQSKGHWILLDETGNPAGEGNCTQLITDDVSGQQKLVAGNENGKYYLRYVIDDNVYPSDTSIVEPTQDQTLTNANLSESATIEVDVSETPFEGSVVASGEMQGIVGDTIDINDYLAAAVRDVTGKDVDRPISWEAQQLPAEGIEVVGSKINFTKDGTYNVRATNGDLYSDWITVTALPQRALSTVSLPSQYPIDKPIYMEDGNKTIDLSNLVANGKDQYGKTFDITDGKWVSDNFGIKIDDNIVTASNPGSYTLYYEGNGVKSNAMTLNVSEKPRLTKIEVNGEIPQLHYDDPQSISYDLSTLDIKGTDQYGGQYKMNPGSYAWKLEKGDYANVNGNKLSGYVMGEDSIKLSYKTVDANGKETEVESNSLPVSVGPAYQISEIYFNGNAPKGVEGNKYNLDNVELLAHNQFNGAIDIPSKEDIVWSVSDLNETQGVSLDSDKRTLTLKKKSIPSGEQVTVILDAALKSNPALVAKNIAITFKQTPELKSIVVSPISELKLNKTENAKLSQYFSVKGVDQYGEEYPLKDIEWKSENNNAVTIKGDVITADKDNSEVKLKAVSGDVTSNEVSISILKTAKVDKVTVSKAPGMVMTGDKLDLNKLDIKVFDQYGDAYTADMMKKANERIRWIIQKGDTKSTLDKDGNIVSFGTKPGTMTIICAVVNSSTDTALAEYKLNIAVTEKPLPNFTDVNKDEWYYKSISYVYGRGIMTGMKPDYYGVMDNMYRAFTVTTLYRLASLDPNVPKEDLKADYKGGFSDVENVKENEWYTKALSWASKNGIMTGYDNHTFGPADPITREQMATILYRYAKQYGHSTETTKDYLTKFTDGNVYSPFAKEALNWCVANKILTGKYDETVLDAGSTITRVETTAVVQRFMEQCDL